MSETGGLIDEANLNSLLAELYGSSGHNLEVIMSKDAFIRFWMDDGESNAEALDAWDRLDKVAVDYERDGWVN